MTTHGPESVFFSEEKRKLLKWRKHNEWNAARIELVEAELERVNDEIANLGAKSKKDSETEPDNGSSKAGKQGATEDKTASGSARGKTGAEARMKRALAALEAEKKELEGNLKLLREQEADPENCPAENPSLLSAIALSGGGIRSATFALGVLQCFAGRGLLRHFDCISTVSGGGYTGSSLQWWWNGRHKSPNIYGVDPSNFPYGTEDPDPDHGTAGGTANTTTQNNLLSYLRQNGNYLLPGSGITIWSGIAIVLRAIVLNLFVWIPAATLVLLAVMYLGNVFLTVEKAVLSPDFAKFESLPEDMGMKIPSTIASAPSDTATADGSDAASKHAEQDTPASSPAAENLEEEQDVGLAEPPGRLVMFSILVVVGIWWILEFLVVSVFYSLYSWIGRTPNSDADQPQEEGSAVVKTIFRGLLIITLLGLIGWLIEWRNLPAGSVELWFGLQDWLPDVPPVAVPITLLLLLVTFAPLIFIRTHSEKGMTRHYSGRRLFESRYGRFLKMAVAVLVPGTLPFVYAIVQENVANVGLAGTISTVFGAAMGVIGHIASTSKSTGRFPVRLVLSAGSVLLLYGILLLSFHFAWSVTVQGIDSATGVFFGVVALVAILSMLLVNINYISPHRFYRDRLMEAFLPDWETVEAFDSQAGAAVNADGFMLSDVWDVKSPGPYPIINTNAVMVNAEEPRLRGWGGDNFALTPIHSGSDVTGWVRTTEFANGHISLPTAMAISGAAANPNTGVGGKGFSRGRFISLVMTLLNFRLGYWVVNPVYKDARIPKPNHLVPGALYAVSRYGHKSKSSYLELSDGGHFENTGLYELIRRRANLILICDGEADKTTSYYSFVTVMRRIEDRFGATLHFKTGMGPERLIPKPADPKAPNYPAGVDYADRGFFIAEVRYQGGKTGTIIYLKTTLIPGLTMKAKGYAGAHPDFPDETTADQFFDAEQFEAYRELGYRIAVQAVDSLKLDEKIVSPLGIKNRDWGIVGI